MQTESPKDIESITAAVDLERYLLVGLDGDIPAAGAPVFGVCQNRTEQGMTAPVATAGFPKCRVGAGGVAVNDPVVSDGMGSVIRASSFIVQLNWGGGAVNVTSSTDPPSYWFSLAGSVPPGGVIIGYSMDNALENETARIKLL